MCPRGESLLTYMIPIAVTAEFCLDGGWCPVSSAVGGRVGRAGVLVAYLVLICCKRGPRRCSPASLRLIAFLRCALSARGFTLGSHDSAGLRAYLAMCTSR